MMFDLPFRGSCDPLSLYGERRNTKLPQASDPWLRLVANLRNVCRVSPRSACISG
jgi:hypothetical protein